MYVGTEISPQRMKLTIVGLLEDRLTKARKSQHSLVDRVTIANQFISSSLWYLLNLWSGDLMELDGLDKLIRDFIWSGQDMGKLSRVDYKTMKKAKKDGGMGVLSIKEHTIALAAKLILWVPIEGDHTLQYIIRKKIGEMLEKRWGRQDYSWLVLPGRTKPENSSKLLTTLCTAWCSLQKFARPVILTNCEAKRKIPLWVPHHMHRIKTKVSCKTMGHAALHAAGLETLGDVLQGGGGWHLGRMSKGGCLQIRKGAS